MDGQANWGEAPDAEAIETLARDALAALPEAFARHLGDVVLLIDEEADAETLASVGVDHPLDLTGVYVGTPMGEKSSFGAAPMPDRIHLYRQAILVEWVETGVRLDDLVRHVVVHEVGHHFGLSDAAMHALEAGA